MERVCPDCLARVEPRDADACEHCGFARVSCPGGDWLPDPLSGLILNGRYRLEARLGAGGMATVFRAERLKLGGQVAIKVLAPRYARTVVAKRFEREAKVISGLSGPHAVRIHDFESFRLEGIAQPVFYIAMELVKGHTLDEILASEGRVNFLWGVDVLRQATRALDEAHGLGIVHRDLKPTNIMIVQHHGATHVKVLDFGIASMTSPEGAAPVEKLTHVGVISGTPEYMSPEQAAGDLGLGPPSDIYALGLIAFEMFAGRRPFQGETSMDTLVTRLSSPPPRLADAVPDPEFPPALAAVVDRMLEKKAEDRYQSASEVLKALAAFPSMHTSPGFVPPAELIRRYATATGLSTEEIGDATARRLAGPRRPRIWLWATSGAVLVGGAAAAVMFLSKVEGDGPASGTPSGAVAPSARVFARAPMEVAAEVSGTPSGTRARISLPRAGAPLHQPMILDVALESAGAPLSLAGPRVGFAVDGRAIPGVEIEKASAVPGRIGLMLPPRPVPGTYRISVEGRGPGGEAVSIAFDYDARNHSISRP